ncbi:MAG: DNA translocase FtsK 4TM domain-containing protein, partial [Bacteroidales bacterium]|nr:DNA translocase FtsK 4TM domain-containing protein [Bacteroidales bacterium]
MASKTGKRKAKKVNRLTDEQKRIIRVVTGVVFLAVCLFTLASLISYAFSWKVDQSIMHDPDAWSTGVGVQNICGKVGYLWANFLIAKLFGLGAFFVPFFIGAISIYCFKIKEVRLLRVFLLSLFGCLIFSLLFAYLTGFFPKVFLQWFSNSAGGSYGHFTVNWLENMLGGLGTGAVIIVLLFIWLTFCTKKVAIWCDEVIFKAFHSPKKEKKVIEEIEEDEEEEDLGEEDLEEEEDQDEIFSMPAAAADADDLLELDTAEENPGDNVTLTIENDENDYLANLTEDEKAHIFDPRLDLSNYKFPSTDLLEDYRNLWHEATNEELESNKTTIVNALANFKIKVDRIVAKSGPTVTLYTIHLSEGGTRIAQVKRLEEYIAMYLGTTGVRVFVL